MRIHFEDHGQDFLAWQLDNNGIVVDVEPFQAWLWCGIRVRLPRLLKVGGFVAYRRPEESGRIRTIRYPIRAIEPDLSPDEFNTRYAVGARCRYYPIAGDAEHRKTVTRTPAWALGHGATVVSVVGVRGGVDINHLVMEC